MARADSATPLVWIYDKDHLRHPFIRLAVDTLAGAGYAVSVIDRASQPGGRRYRHVAMGGSLLPSRAAGPRDGRRGSLPSAAGGARQLLTAIRAVLRRVLPASLMFGVKTLLFYLRAPFQILRHQPAVIVATRPLPAAAGWAAAMWCGARLVYYPFELYGEQFYASVAPVWVALERLELRWAVDALITQNAERARIYTSERAVRVAPVIVHNYKPRRAVAPSGKLRDLLGLDADDRIVLYEGLLQDGRCLPELLQSVAHLSDDVRLVLMGEQKLWWRRHAAALLDDPVVRGRILVAPWVPHDDVLGYVADADVGVIIYDGAARNNFLCEPGKLSDYVLAGVPIVAPEFPTVGPVIRMYGIGATFSKCEPAQIAGAIHDVLSVPSHVWREALRRAGDDLIWETQVPNLLAAVAGTPVPSTGGLPSPAEPTS